MRACCRSGVTDTREHLLPLLEAIAATGASQIAVGYLVLHPRTENDLLAKLRPLGLDAMVGDEYARRGRATDAERYYQLAEDLAGPDRVQTEATLALFLAERNRRLADAVTIAETVAATRRDIFTEDALAWSYYKVGRLDAAAAASQRALRTGTRDERIRLHAAQIRAARSDRVRRDLLAKPGLASSDPSR